jgi:2-iminobutanoate/2-iminopropanoate deaminase
MSKVRQGGGLVFVSGTVAVLEGSIVDGGIGAQVTQAVHNLDAALRGVGRSLQEVVRCLCLITDASMLPAFNAAYEAAFAAVDPKPTRTTLIVGLPHPDALFEIEAIAAIDPH